MQPPRISDIAPKTSLEHIMPQNIDKWNNYIRDNNKSRIASESDVKSLHQNYKNRLGNLTLVDPSKNKSIKNDPYIEKLKEYKKSKIDITNHLDKWPVWNVESIADRQKKLAELGSAIWQI